MAATARYQIRHDRGWYVIDTRTGAMWPGLTRPGARQLADRLNRTTA